MSNATATHYSTEGHVIFAHTAIGRFFCVTTSAEVALAAALALRPGVVPAGFVHAPHWGKGACLR